MQRLNEFNFPFGIFIFLIGFGLLISSLTMGNNIVCLGYEMNQRDSSSNVSSNALANDESLKFDEESKGTEAYGGRFPLFRNLSDVVKGDELAFFGLPEFPNVLVLDNATGFTPLASWNMTQIDQPNVVTGDFDGDGKDELLYAGEGSANPAMIFDDADASFILVKTFNETSNEYQVGTGDFDADGIYEVIIASREAVTVYDDALSSYAEITTLDMSNQFNSSTWNISRIHCGSIDNDGADEIIITGGNLIEGSECVFLLIIDDDSTSYTILYEEYILSKQWPPQSGKYFPPWGSDVTTGDIDGDGRGEVILIYLQTLGSCMYALANYLNITILDYEYECFTTTRTESDEIWCWNNPRTISKTRVIACNLDTDDYLDEFVIAYEVDNGYEINGLIITIYDDANRWWYNEPFGEIYTETFYYEKSFSLSGLIPADIDCDGRFEIIFNYWALYDDPWLSYQYYRAKVFDYEFRLESYDLYNTQIESSIEEEPFLPVAGDFDGDSFRIRFLNMNQTHHMRYIIALLAAPPTVSGISQNYGNSYTGWQQATTESEQHTTGYSIEASTFIFGHFEDPFGIFKADVKYGVEYQIGCTETTGHSTTYRSLYMGGHTDNSIIYSATSIAHFHYEIVAHPNSSMLGDLMTISVPYKVGIEKQTQEYYNTLPDNWQIGNETFSHTVGQPQTYKSHYQASVINNKYGNAGSMISDPIAVGQGVQATEVAISLMEEKYKSYHQSWGSNFEFATSVFGAGWGFSIGGAIDTGHTVGVGKNTEYIGRVGDIEDWDDYAQNSYSFGLLIYNYQTAVGLSYQIVDYYVEDYVGTGGDTSRTGFIPSFSFWLTLITMIFVSIASLGRKKIVHKK